VCCDSTIMCTYCHDSHTMLNCCAHYCTVTTHTLCIIVVHIIVLSPLTHYVKLLYTVLYCHDSHTMWNCCTHYCTITTHTLCGNVVHIIVVSPLTHYVKLLCTLLYYHDSHPMLNCCTHYCTVTHSVWVVTVQYCVQQFHIVCEWWQYNNVYNNYT
jgi:hypothetical protein